MAKNSIFDVTGITPQKLTYEDFTSMGKALGGVATSIDSYLKNKDLDTATQAEEALKAAAYKGDTQGIQDIMQFASSNIRDNKNKSLLLNQGRIGLEGIAVNEINLDLDEASRTGDMDRFKGALAKAQDAQGWISPEKQFELTQKLQTAAPAIQETGDVRSIISQASTANKAQLAKLTQASNQAFTEVFKDKDAKEGLLFDQVNGVLIPKSITPELVNEYFGGVIDFNKPADVEVGIKSLQEKQIRTRSAYGSRLKQLAGNIDTDPFEAALQPYKQALAQRGVDPTAFETRVRNIQGTLTALSPDSQRNVVSAVAKSKENETAALAANQAKYNFAYAFTKAEADRLIATGKLSDESLDKIIGGVTPDWFNYGGDNADTLRETIYAYQKDPESFDFTRAPTNAEIGAALALAKTQGFGGDTLFDSKKLTEVLRNNINNKPVDNKASQRLIIDLYNRELNDKNTVDISIKARSSYEQQIALINALASEGKLTARQALALYDSVLEKQQNPQTAAKNNALPTPPEMTSGNAVADTPKKNKNIPLPVDNIPKGKSPLFNDLKIPKETQEKRDEKALELKVKETLSSNPSESSIATDIRDIKRELTRNIEPTAKNALRRELEAKETALQRLLNAKKPNVPTSVEAFDKTINKFNVHPKARELGWDLVTDRKTKQKYYKQRNSGKTMTVESFNKFAGEK